METIYWLQIIFTPLALVPVALHLLVIYLINLPNMLKHENRTYLTHMSIIEITYTVFISSTAFLRMTRVDATTYEYICASFQMFTLVTWSLLMIAMTINKFLQIKLNIKYGLYVTKRVTRIVIALCWLCGPLCAIIFALLKHAVDLSMFYIFYTYVINLSSGVHIFTFIVAYTYIYHKSVKAKRVDSKQHRSVSATNSQNRSESIPIHRFVPFWLVLNSIVFLSLPSTALSIIRKDGNKPSEVVYFVAQEVHITAISMDALFNLLVNKRIRKKCKQLVQRVRGDANEVNVDNQETRI